MNINIPGRKEFELKNMVFDFNGTIAIDGKLIKGVADNINELACSINFYVISADTFGSVEKELEHTNCIIIKIEKTDQDKSKLEFIKKLGAENTIAVGNGRNDKLMLKEAIIGIAVLQAEGICSETLVNSDIVVNSILDVFGFLKKPKRLIATLRN